MNPNLGLLAASGLANFLLRTTAEWLVCWLLARLLRSAQSRFNVWLAMLLGFAAQWVWLGVNICRAAFPGHVYAARGVQTGAIAPAGTRIALTENTAGTVAQAIAILLVAYFVVLVWRILGSAAARVRLGRAMRYKNAPASELETTFQEVLQHSSQLRNDVRECKLWVLPGLPSPATLGWLRPQVLLPATWNAQDPAELRVVFWHELKHVERRDALWSAMVRGCRTLLWFHPCVHHAAAALDAERELACDAAVVSEHPHSRDVYATCLVRLARQRDLAAASAVAGIEMASGAALLSARVRSILDDTAGSSWTSRAGRGALSLMLLGVMAAAVPTLNLLFAAVASGPATQIPMAMAIFDSTVPKLRSVAAAGVRMQETALSAQPTAVANASLPGIAALQHDEALAAQHRVAMDVLTESTGMDVPAESGDARWSGPADDAATRRGSSRQASPSWTSIAVNAAENAGPLMVGGDHDGDGHH